MTKRSKRSRRHRDSDAAQKAKPSKVQVPSAATFFRFGVLDATTTGLMDRATSLLKPVLWARDGESVKQIRRARTAEELIDLVTLARGLGEPAWQKRMHQFGPEVLPLISERLKTVKGIKDKDVRDMAVEKLIVVLRWHGDAGAQVLLERFDDLNDYGQSLACVMLGLLEAGEGADQIWRFYQKVMYNRRESYFVGALWGLIDLKDGRAGQALVGLLKGKRFFYELFGFFSLAGDAHAVLPLTDEIQRRPDEYKGDPLMALIGVAHRIGREALLAEFEKGAAPDEPQEDRQEMEALADELLAKPVEDVQEYFGLFHRGLTENDLAGLFRRRV
jgi:hypothetical protein